MPYTKIKDLNSFSSRGEEKKPNNNCVSILGKYKVINSTCDYVSAKQHKKYLYYIPFPPHSLALGEEEKKKKIGIWYGL